MSQAVRDLPHGTTIVAATCDHGVVLAGDRRATTGNLIAKRDLEKVFRSDEFSALGYAGTGSLGIEFARLFGVELEHYEKMEGRSLSLDGKANLLARMVRGNLGAGHAGPGRGAAVRGVRRGFRAGPDLQLRRGRRPVRGAPVLLDRVRVTVRHGALKKLYADGMTADDAVLACVQALYDAADDDSATGGPDLSRRIFPIVATITADGYRRLSEAEAEDVAGQVVRQRLAQPDGPRAQLR